MSLRVYLNYVSEDRARVRPIAGTLRAAGFNVWFDVDELLPGDDWKSAVELAIRSADVFLALFSESRTELSARPADLELLEVLADDKPYVVPVLLGVSGVPFELQHIHALSLDDEGSAEALVQALTRVGSTLGPRIESPRPPAALVDACIDGDSVLYVGAGISAPSGLPVWHTLIPELVRRAEAAGDIRPGRAARLRRTLDTGEFDLVADSLMRSVPEDRAQAWLREIFLAPGLTPPATHALLRRVGATAALTTNFDTLLEQSLLSPNDRVYTPEDAESLLEALTQREFFVAKLYGQLGVSSSLLLAPSEYEDRIVGNRRFAEFMELLFASRTVFFVGCSLDGIASYLEGLRFRSSDARHFALVAVSGSAWEVKAEQLRGRYGIEVLPYVAEEGHAEVTSFLDELVARVDAGKADRGTAGQSGERGGIRSISLRNVGPFRGPEPVELSFDRGWNVLLGDNGVGKSTVLKAIAVAFAGRSAEPYAERLISHDAEEARVVVRTARETYTTVIARTSDGCEVTSLPSRPLEAEGLLILAFPALRSVSWRRAKASATDFSSRKPDPEDVLPLLTGDPDPRLDELKDWLYSIESWSRMQRDVDHARVRRELFRVLREVASGVEIDYLGADDRGGLEVSLFGEPAPLEVVSQGTASLFGWLGVLVRRLYRVSRDSSHALGSPAVVLLDEIDAHMHPGWQQELVPRLSAAFPNVQFIVTTHSALVLGNLESGRVYSFERSGDFPSPIKANAHVIEPGLGVSGLLTSSRFGLATELDQDTQGLLDEKVNYVIKDSLSDEDRARLEEVDRLLDNRGLLTRYKDPLYTRFLRAAARESNASAQELRTEYTDVDRERDRRMIDELRAELAEENEGADS